MLRPPQDDSITVAEARAGRLRERDREGAAEVRPVELFFDLVYVLAIWAVR